MYFSHWINLFDTSLLSDTMSQTDIMSDRLRFDISVQFLLLEIDIFIFYFYLLIVREAAGWPEKMRET